MRIYFLTVLFIALLFSSVSAVEVSDVQILELGEDGFVVGWDTDVPATSQLFYGATGRLGLVGAEDVNLKTSHQLQIDNLQDNQIYFFRASGQDASGDHYFSIIGITRTYPKNVDSDDASNSIVLDRLKAFPSAQGHGVDEIFGGKGGSIFYVTTLSSQNTGSWNSQKGVYEGSFRYAMEHPDPGYIIFRVGGVIDGGNILDRRIHAKKTILGGTAPYPGITILGRGYWRVKDSGKSDLIVRGVNFLGTPSMKLKNDDAMTLVESTHAIFSDNSFGWGADEVFSLARSNWVTAQRNFLFEAIPGHNTGSILNANLDDRSSGGISFHNNAFVHISHRFPNIEARKEYFVDVVNNFVHNWNWRLHSHRYDFKLNDINNYYQTGDNTNNNGLRSLWNPSDYNFGIDPDPRIYTSGNVVDGQLTNIPWTFHISGKGYEQGEPLPSHWFVRSPHPLGTDLNVKDAQEVFDYNIKGMNIGNRYYMNENGQRVKYMLPEVKEYFDDAITGDNQAYKNDQSDFKVDKRSSGDAYIDNDYDGMADAWEREHGLNVGLRDHESIKREWFINDVKFLNDAGFTNIQMYDDYVHGGFEHLIFEQG